MLNLQLTRIVRTYSENVQSGALIPEEGMALVYVRENGETRVKPSAGAANEVFAGVSYSRHAPPALLPYVQETVVRADGTVELVRPPVNGQLLVKLAGAPLEVVNVAAADATKVRLDNLLLRFFAGQAGKPVYVQYLYAPTVMEARTVIGDGQIGGLASTSEGIIGMLKDADFGTNMFDASVDWTSALQVKLAAGGTFTVGTVADHIPGIVVKNSPSAASPFLQLSVNVA